MFNISLIYFMVYISVMIISVMIILLTHLLFNPDVDPVSISILN